ncbi:MAG: glycosyltransferase [Clostridiales bacterium]|nr:glycosyltransferase [Clostridiales bacterium]
MIGIKRLKNYLHKNGIKNTAAKIYEYLLYRKKGRAYMAENRPSETELRARSERRFIRGTKFSIVVPLYNSNPRYLEELIASVIAQTYGKWELLLIDGSPLSYSLGEETAMKYVKEEGRIKYRRLGGNLGISGNTNHGVSVSSGEYIVFLDHDDLLRRDALYRAAEAIEQTGADFLYSDEMNFSEKPENVSAVTLKPDFSKYTLFGINCIGHMCVVKKELYNKVGGLRREYDGSQDYDLVLRLSEKAKKIYHLPYVLYYWRIHSQSVASGIEAKDYCLEKAKDAVKKHLEGMEIKAEIGDIAGAESAYRLKYDFDRKQKVSLIVCFSGDEKAFERYMNNILDAVSENNVEIISVGGYNIFDGVYNISFSQEYNFCKMANIGAREARGSLLMFLDGRVLPKSGFLDELIPYASFEDVGCVGGKLIDRRGFIYALGYRLDPDKILEPYLKGLAKNSIGYMRRLKIAGNCTCLLGGFMMVKKKDFIAVGGFDEMMGVISGGADLCLRLLNRGNNIITPYAEAVVSGKIREDFDEFYSLNKYAVNAGDKYLRLPF